MNNLDYNINSITYHASFFPFSSQRQGISTLEGEAQHFCAPVDTIAFKANDIVPVNFNRNSVGFTPFNPFTGGVRNFVTRL